MTQRTSESMPVVNRMAAGIDIGSRENYVAVGPDSRYGAEFTSFESFTGELEKMADWLKERGITTVAMESTGVYWIPVFDVLEKRGFEVILANAKAIKNVPGRKSDALDCQWIQKLHSHGLLAASFQPGQELKTLRALVRQRGTLVRHACTATNLIRKALRQMNIVLENVVSDTVGLTGMRILKAILAGERDPQKLAALRDPRCKRSAHEIAQALYGNYKPEYLFQMKQALQSYEFVQSQIRDCDQEILAQLHKMRKKADSSSSPGDGPLGDHSVTEAMKKISGVDLTAIEGIGPVAAMIILAEIGTDMSKWPTVKHFCSWLALCPGIKKSGGKMISSSTRKVNNRAATALRLCAVALMKSKTALGARARRLKSRLGPAKAITAVAHLLARLVYTLLKRGTEYVSIGVEQEEKRYQERRIRAMAKTAKKMGYELVKRGDAATVVAAASC